MSAPPSDEAIERAMGRLLQIGVFLAAALAMAGGALYLARHGGERVALGTFAGEPQELRSPHGAVAYALSGHARGLVQVALLVLVATPVTRVAFSLVAFLRQRDYIYVAITTVVLLLLGFSLWSGRG
jgi:uncharacterized membrane protein